MTFRVKTKAGEVKDIKLDDCNWYVREGEFLILVQLKDEYLTEARGVLSSYQAEQMNDLPLRTRETWDEIWKNWDLTHEPPGDPWEEMMKSFE